MTLIKIVYIAIGLVLLISANSLVDFDRRTSLPILAYSGILDLAY
jgi:hypothetical protein